MYLYRLVKNSYDRQVDGAGLAIFRIVFSLVLFAEACHLFWFRHLIFDIVPYLEPYEIDLTAPFLIWMVVILMIAFGLFTRAAAIANFLFCLLFLSTIRFYYYNMFGVYLAVSFLFIFLPTARCISIDKLLKELKYSNTRFRYKAPATVSQLNYSILIIVGIAFVYFDSALYKLVSPMWLTGLGVWKPASLPYMALNDLSALLNVEWLIRSLGYLSLAFEFFFIFLFPFARYRVALLVIGLGLHMGILIAFPIPYFAIGFGSLYILMVPVSFWRRILKSAPGKERLTFYYDAECPLCARTKIVIEHLDTRHKVQFKSVQYYAALNPALHDIPEAALLDDIYSVDTRGKVYHGVDTYAQVFNSIWYLKPLSWLIKLPGIYQLGKAVYAYVAKNRTTERCTEENCGYTPPTLPPKDSDFKLLQNITLYNLKVGLATGGIALLIILQCFASYRATIPLILRSKIGFEQTRAGGLMERVAAKVLSVSSLIGITHHDVFMDHHFAGYNHIISISAIGPDGKEILLPVTKPTGQPGNYLTGSVWGAWEWGVVYLGKNRQRIEKGVRDYTAFWAGKNKLDVNNYQFIIRVKRIDEPQNWEYDFLRKQMAKPWVDAGTARWRSNTFSSDISDINTL